MAGGCPRSVPESFLLGRDRLLRLPRLSILSIVDSLGFTAGAIDAGFLPGIRGGGRCFSAPSKACLIDPIGICQVIRIGIWFVGLAADSDGKHDPAVGNTLLCIMEVVGYVLTGTYSQPVLISNWFGLSVPCHGRLLPWIRCGRCNCPRASD